MKQLFYFSIISLLFGACASGKQVAFQDDAYDNTRETKVYASAEIEQQAEDDLYEDEYYLSETPQTVNNYYNCNCGGGFYDPWRNNRWGSCNSGFGLSMGYGWGNYNNWYSPYANTSPYYYDPVYGYSQNPYYYSPYASSWGYSWGYNNYYGSQNTGNWSSTETGTTSNTVYGPRGSVSSNHRGNPNTIGSNNPTYTRDFYNKRADAIDKSNSSSNTSTDVSRTSLDPTSRATRSTSTTSRTYTTGTSNSSNSSYNRGGTTTRSTNTNSNSSYQRSSTPTYNSSPSRNSSASPSTPSKSTSGTSSGSSTSRRRP
ncbi:MAG: hypothetical protein ACLGGV_08680 [Bacteroidia bacterium]